MSETQVLVEMAMSFSRSRMLCAAARLGVADAIEEGAKTIEELAVMCGAEPRPLHRLMRALAAIGIVAESEPGYFVLTPLGRPLRRNAPDSAWPSVVFWSDLLADNWSQLTECIRTGETAPAIMARHGLKSRWAQDPAGAAEILRGVMGTAATSEYTPFADSWDFTPWRKVADLGGGGGSLIAAILKRYPHLEGILVERAAPIEAAGPRLAAEELTSRCQLIAADLLTGVPPGADVYILKHVLHGYDDEHAVLILANCAAVMPPASRLLVIEFVLPRVVDRIDRELERCLMSDLNMLAATGGRERTEADWRKLLNRAGLTLRQVFPVKGDPARILEASLTAAVEA